MPVCSICSSNYKTFKALVTHLKFSHNCHERSTFMCAEKNCYRTFTSLRCFRQHFSQQHNTVGNTFEWSFSEQTKNSNYGSNISIDDTNDQQCIPSSNTDESDESTSSKEDYVNNFKRKLDENILVFISKFYGDTTLCRKNVQDIMSNLLELLIEPLDIFKKFLMNQSDQRFDEINPFFSELKTTIKEFSEYLTFKKLEKTECFIKPVEYSVGQKVDKVKGCKILVQDYKAHFIPFKSVLKKFFELPSVFSQTLLNMEYLLAQDEICSIIQTEFWKNKIHTHGDNIVIPFNLYFDEYESGNPLGSHSGIHKLGAVYLSIPVLPVDFMSRLENIFLVNLFHSSDLKEYGSKMIFSKIIQECNDLFEYGVTLNTEGKEMKVYFCLGLLLGDNLGLQTLLGFTECFRANYFCRFCKCNKDETRTQCSQNNEMLRNRINYTSDLTINNLSLTGIKENCVWNDVQFFHATENFSVDIAHDIFEGVALFDLEEILYNFIIVDKLFPIEILNCRLKYFNYGTHNINKPPLLTFENIKSKKIRMSCSEVKTLVLVFGVMFAKLVPVNNKCWQIYTTLREILQIVLSPFVAMETPVILQNLIAKHHSMYIDVFNEKLKPKHHILVHYPHVMKKVGPLLNLCSLKFESKHRQSKLSANVVSSRLNITKTLAIKHQLQVCARFISKKGFQAQKTHENEENSVNCFDIITDLENICSYSNMSRECFQESRILNKYIDGNHIYKKNDIIMLQVSDKPSFGKILEILQNQQQEVYFIYLHLNTILFNSHFYSFEVEETSRKECVPLNNIIFTPHIITSLCDDKMLITKF